MTRILIPLIPLLFAAAPAFAAGTTGQAQFAPGTAVPTKIVVNETIWTCADGACTGPAESRAVALQKACGTLAREIGPVTTLAAGSTALTGAAIDQCNVKAGRGAAALAAK